MRRNGQIEEFVFCEEDWTNRLGNDSTPFVFRRDQPRSPDGSPPLALDVRAGEPTDPQLLPFLPLELCLTGIQPPPGSKGRKALNHGRIKVHGDLLGSC